MKKISFNSKRTIQTKVMQLFLKSTAVNASELTLLCQTEERRKMLDISKPA